MTRAPALLLVLGLVVVSVTPAQAQFDPRGPKAHAIRHTDNRQSRLHSTTVDKTGYRLIMAAPITSPSSLWPPH